MPVLSQIVLVLHVLAAMLTFGGTTFFPRRVREAVGAERSEARRQMPALARQSKIFGMTGLFILLTGLLLAAMWPGGLVAMHSPFKVPVRFHVALTLTLIWWGLFAFAIGPTVERIVAVVDSEAPIESAKPFVKRIGMLTGISHLLLTVLVVLMLWRL